MHPDIRNFFEEEGHDIVEYKFHDRISYTSDLRRLTINPLAILYYNDGVKAEAKYYPYAYKPDYYSEMEMLRLIKLKAFL